MSTNSNYDDYPAPDFPSNNSAPKNDSRTSGRQSADRPSDSGYGSVSSSRPSANRRRPSEIGLPGRRSDDSYRRPDDAYGTRDENLATALVSRRQESQDTTRREDSDREFGYKLGQSTRSTAESASTVNQPPAPSTTATSAVIIPNKSTIEEEYIDIPYGRDGRDSGIEDRNLGMVRDDGGDSANDYPNLMSRPSPPGGLGGLTARLKSMEDEEDLRPGSRSGDDSYDKYVRPVLESGRSSPSDVASQIREVGTSVAGETEKIRSEYEYKIATMQLQLSSLQHDLGNATESERLHRESEKRVHKLEEELVGFRQVCISCHLSLHDTDIFPAR